MMKKLFYVAKLDKITHLKGDKVLQLGPDSQNVLSQIWKLFVTLGLNNWRFFRTFSVF